MSSLTESAFLLLSDGTLFEGFAFGSAGIVFGEVVFNTGITGYQEVLTDPSYFGQLVTFTYPELGNTGTNIDDQESDHPSVKGIVCRNFSKKPSSWRSEASFEQWLKNESIIGIWGVDTRALVRHLRESGSMNGVICSNKEFSPQSLFKELQNFPSMQGLNLAEKVTTKRHYSWRNVCPVEFDQRKKRFEAPSFKVVAIDFGIKKSILQRLVAHGCEVEVLPASSDISLIRKFSPEGVFFSNGPGDPASVASGIELAKTLIRENELPLFGICLGHQILGLALGGKTFKLPYGHRGLNHPCGTSGKLEITSQNHGFALKPESLPEELVEITHLNLNDKTVAGIQMNSQPVFGIQYHPEASPGPHDADQHFDRFVALMAERRIKVV